MSNTTNIAQVPHHPDTISGLAPDCRRVLRDAFARVQVARQKGDASAIASATDAYRAIVGEWADGDSAWAARVYGSEVPEAYRAPAPRRVPVAILKYKRRAEDVGAALRRAEFDASNRAHHLRSAAVALSELGALEAEVSQLDGGPALIARYDRDCERAQKATR